VFSSPAMAEQLARWWLTCIARTSRTAVESSTGRMVVRSRQAGVTTGSVLRGRALSALIKLIEFGPLWLPPCEFCAVPDRRFTQHGTSQQRRGLCDRRVAARLPRDRAKLIFFVDDNRACEADG